MIVSGGALVARAVRSRAMDDTVLQPAPMARLIVTYPEHFGRVFLRGDAPLHWGEDLEPTSREGDRSIFDVPIPLGHSLEVKLVRDDGRWAAGRNLVLLRGDVIELRPSFASESGGLGPWYTHPIAGRAPLRFRVLVPPSYAEQPELRYPVIYAQDGQSLFSDGSDGFGEWDLDLVMSELWSLGSLGEVIVVAIETAEHRLDWLSPVKDRDHGGGRGDEHLAAIVDHLKPHIDRTLRTQPEARSTAVLGSSMGGLFSFFAAWTRPDVFGSAICLSSSFWWADRWAVRKAEEGFCPIPRPRLYLDSGASRSALERDANARDGQHHTRAMERSLVGHCYEPGQDLFVLAFPGHRHNAASWAARVAIPLQLMFPRGDG